MQETEVPEICKSCPENETCNNDPVMWNCKTEDMCINVYVEQ